MAGGFSINISNVEKFKFYLADLKTLLMISSIQKPLFLDSKIAPSAVNLDFMIK